MTMRLYFYNTVEIAGTLVTDDSNKKGDEIERVSVFCVPAETVQEASILMSRTCNVELEWTGPIAICSPVTGMEEVFDVTEFQNF
jgi:hypothetical protein